MMKDAHMRSKRTNVAALLLACSALVLAPAEALATGNEVIVVDQPISGPAWTETGAWRSKVQQVFDQRTRTLTRRLYEIWDTEPSLDLDFAWTPDRPEADRAGRITGSGHVVWRVKGIPSYRHDGVVAEYRGGMRDGKPDGIGIYVNAAGFYFDGAWRGGLMHGRGTLKLPSGDEYTGAFRDGRADGLGRYIDITGEIYDGQFLAGHRHGRGTTTLPSGRAYASQWSAGREIASSHALRLAQATGKAIPGTADDIRIGLTIDRRLPPRKPSEAPRPKKWDLWYAVSNTPDGFVIQPDNVRLMSVWKGNGRIHEAPEFIPEEGDSHGVFGLDKSQLHPIKMNIEVQNRSSVAVQVTGAYLDVAESKSDLQPAIQIDHMRGDSSCEAGMFEAHFRLENYGWSPAQGASLRFSFASPGQAPPAGAQAFTHAVGNIAKDAKVDLERHLAAAGVNVAGLKRYVDKGFPCKSKDKAQCLASLKSAVSLGSLAPIATVKDASVMIQATGTLEYTWRDASGGQQRQASPLVVPLTLALLARELECGEGAGPEVIAAKPQLLRLDATKYRMPISYRTSIPAGRVGRLIASIDAAKSSSHAFRIVLQLSDGREIGSRSIRLTHYRPSWFAEDTPNPAR